MIPMHVPRNSSRRIKTTIIVSSSSFHRSPTTEVLRSRGDFIFSVSAYHMHPNDQYFLSPFHFLRWVMTRLYSSVQQRASGA